MMKLSGIIGVCLLICSVSFSQTSAFNDEANQSLIWQSVYDKILDKYVEMPDETVMVTESIRAMLESLDPFSIFMTSEEVIESTISLSGKYGGVGLYLDSASCGIVVRQVFEGNPAAIAGILPTDCIIEIDGQDAQNIGIGNAQTLLRGEPGSTVKLRVVRRGHPLPIDYELNRAVVRISPVPYYTILHDSIAYVTFNQVSEGSSLDVKKAILELKNRNNVSGVILDMRGNGGGYMKEALAIAEFFLPQGSKLLRIKGRTMDTVYTSKESPIFSDIELVVLIDGFTASSAEILSGALQDNDRAVFIGQATYGKGLVQNIYDMPGNTQIRLSTGYYFTPSGRCIQRPEFNNSLTGSYLSPQSEFRSRNGRLLSGSGGISPDLVTEPSPYDPMLDELAYGSWIFGFALNYLEQHEHADINASFHLNDAEYKAFIEYLQISNFQWNSPLEVSLLALKEATLSAGMGDQTKDALAELEAIIQIPLSQQLAPLETEVRKLIEQEIMYLLHGSSGRFSILMREDEEIQNALNLLADKKKFQQILQTEH